MGGQIMNATIVSASTDIKALRMIRFRLRPPPGLIFHFDCAGQYASEAFHFHVAVAGMIGLINPKGDCWGTAVIETLFGFRNVGRLHATQGCRSPMAFETQEACQGKKACRMTILCVGDKAIGLQQKPRFR